MISKKLLKNNVTLLIQNEENFNSCSIGFWFSVGSRNEKKGQLGITHFTEHLLFKGTKNLTTHEIAVRFDRMGGGANAFTEREDVCLFCTIPYTEENFKTAVETMCDMSQNCIFPEEEMERERTVVENEIAAVEDDPEESALDFAATSIWPDKTISRSITGSVSDVEAITREMIAKWYDENFVHGELTVCAAGKVDEELLVNQLEKLGQHKKCINYPETRHFNEFPEFKAGNYFKKSDFNQGQLYVLYPFGNTISEKDNYAMSVFNALAGDTMSSRLFESLRERKGFCYSTYSFFTIYEDAVAWCAFAASDEKNCVEAGNLLQEEVEKLVSVPVTEGEIEAAKEHICGEELLLSSDSEYLMKRLQRNYSLGLELRDTKSVIEYIRNLNKNDIMELIHKLIIEENKAFVCYGPKLSGKQKRNICR